MVAKQCKTLFCFGLGVLVCALCLPGLSAAAWSPQTFPNPGVNVGQCGRSGHISRICDPDSVLSMTAANAVDGILKEIVLPAPPYAAAPCTGLAPDRLGFQARISAAFACYRDYIHLDLF